jgi:hypothetical protein
VQEAQRTAAAAERRAGSRVAAARAEAQAARAEAAQLQERLQGPREGREAAEAQLRSTKALVRKGAESLTPVRSGTRQVADGMTGLSSGLCTACSRRVSADVLIAVTSV